MDEERPYEIVASAEDRAGNTAEKVIGIQVVKEKSMAERVAGPIKQIFRRKESDTSDDELKMKPNGKEGDKRSGIIWAIVLCWGIAGAFGYVKVWRPRKLQKKPHKREDAG